jgi:hypothetical protein
VKTISILITYLSIGSPLIPIAFLFFRSTFKRRRYLVILSVLLVFTFLTDTGSFLVLHWLGSNITFLNLCAFIQFVTCSLLYQHLFQSKQKALINCLSATFTIFFFLNSIFFEGLSNFQSATFTVQSILLSIYSVKYYRHLFGSLNSRLTFAEKYGVFWLNGAILYYFSLNLWLFAISHYAIGSTNEHFRMVLWMVHNANNIIKNLMFAASIYWCTKKTEQWELSMMN